MFRCLRSVPSIQRKLLYIVFATALISLVYLLTTTSEDTNRDTKNVHKFHQQQETSSKVEERKDADKDKGAVGSVITGAIKPNQPGDVKPDDTNIEVQVPVQKPEVGDSEDNKLHFEPEKKEEAPRPTSPFKKESRYF